MIRGEIEIFFARYFSFEKKFARDFFPNGWGGQRLEIGERVADKGIGACDLFCSVVLHGEDACLGEVAGSQVREFLSSYLRTFGERDRGRLRQLVFEVLSRIPAEGAGSSIPAPAAPGGTP